MSAALQELEERARGLAAEERARLVEMLETLRSPLSDIDAEWAREIEERIAAFDHGEVPAYAAEHVFAEARRLSRQ